MGLRIADGTTDVMRMSVVSNVYGSELWKMAVYGVQSQTETDLNKKDEPASVEQEAK